MKMNHTKKKVFTLAGVLCVLAVCAGIIFTMVYKTTSNYTATYYADIDIEGYGVITVALDGESAPETVENFVTLAQSGFYDGLTFHRIIEGFMMQGGDPNGDGTGGSGTTVTGEFSANGIENNLSHTRGAVSMARSSDYDSASSQFFIVQQDSTYLDGNYAVFGYVISGMDIVDKICEEAEPIDDNGLISPEEQPVIQSIQIYE
jgi:cyclophilin family peptidyl-prolyl cis-trans isomerase